MSGNAIAGRGLFGAANAVPMRNGPPLMVRPPSITATAPPAVASTTVMTSAGVVGYGRDPDNNCFEIVCTAPAAGITLGATGTITVALAGNILAPNGNFFVAASWASFVISGSSSAMTVTWTATENVRASARLVIHVEKTVSV